MLSIGFGVYIKWLFGLMNLHITMAVEKDRPPQRFVCALIAQASHYYGLPLTAGVMHVLVECAVF